MKLFKYLIALSYLYTEYFVEGSSYTSCQRDCGHHGNCYHYFSREYCRCSSGYTGDHCQTANHCQNKCQHRGRCENLNASPYFKCTCNYGYFGERCENDHCTTSSPCQNGGICAHYHKSPFYKCYCANGYTGTNCQVSPCHSNPCQNGGTCSPNSRLQHYHCSCLKGYTGNNCENSPTTTAQSTVSVTKTVEVTTTTSTSQPIVTSTNKAFTTSPDIKQTCSKFSSVLDVAENVMENNVFASICPSGNHTSSEAFVLNNCQAQSSAFAWKQGYNVRTFCKLIPPYTPVATFKQGQYHSSTSTSGIFIGCLVGSSGFTIAMQKCDQAPLIEHVDFGTGTTLGYQGDFYTIRL